MANLVTTCCDANSALVRRDFAARYICGTTCTPGPSGAEQPFTSFTGGEFFVEGSQAIPVTFPAPGGWQRVTPDLPSVFPVFSVNDTNNATIVPSGANQDVISTTSAGTYEFQVAFSVTWPAQAQDPADPIILLALADAAGIVPYTGTNGFPQMYLESETVLFGVQVAHYVFHGTRTFVGPQLTHLIALISEVTLPAILTFSAMSVIVKQIA